MVNVIDSGRANADAPYDKVWKTYMMRQTQTRCVPLEGLVTAVNFRENTLVHSCQFFRIVKSAVQRGKQSKRGRRKRKDPGAGKLHTRSQPRWLLPVTLCLSSMLPTKMP